MKPLTPVQKNLTLKQVAERLSLKRPRLIARMREAGLLDAKALPRHPERDRAFLKTHDGHWYHPTLGLQYSQSTRITPRGLNWLADLLGIPQPTTAEPQSRDHDL